MQGIKRTISGMTDSPVSFHYKAAFVILKMHCFSESVIHTSVPGGPLLKIIKKTLLKNPKSCSKLCSLLSLFSKQIKKLMIDSSL